MISPLSNDKPQLIHSKYKLFSPSQINQQSNILQRKSQPQQSDILSTIQPKIAHFNNNLQHGLSKLLKVSPYNQLINQKSLVHINNQDSISQNHVSGCSPQIQTSHHFFKAESKQSITHTQNTIQRRLESNYKVTPHKKSFDSSSQLISCRVKDKQTITTLQQLLQRTSHILQNYKDEILKYEVENKKLKEKIAILKNQ